MFIFGNLDLTFNVISGICFEPVQGFSPHLDRYIIVTSLIADYIWQP